MKVMTRKEARALGLKFYFTGKPCVHGHVSIRLAIGGRCKECSRAYSRRPDERKKAAARTRAWYTRNRYSEEMKKWHRRYKGLPEPTRPETDFCEICGKIEWRALSLDHCHASGKFRGWLCSGCNSGLGHFGDSPNRLRNAAEYLEKNG